MSNNTINAVVGLPGTEEKAYAQTNNRIDRLEAQFSSGLSEAQMHLQNAENRLDAGIESSAEALGQRIDNIIAVSADSEGNSELVDIRSAADGTVYTSAGTAVRSQISGITEDIGGFVYTLTATSSSNVAIRVDIPGAHFTQGAVVYVKFLSMTGGSPQSLRLYGQIDSENFDRLLTYQQIGTGAFVTLERDYIAMRLYTAVEDGSDGVNAKAVMICSRDENASGYIASLLERMGTNETALQTLDTLSAKKTEIINATNNTTCRIFRKVCCCGDSYTAGYIYPAGHESPSRVNEEYSWVHYLAQITGNDFVNCGVSGANADSWLSSERGLAKAAGSGRAQAYLVGLGINDSSDDEGRNLALGTADDIGTEAVSYYGRMSRIVTELYGINPYAEIFLMTCPDGKNGSYNSERYDGYNQAVRDITQYFSDKAPKVHCLDLAAKKEMFTYNASLRNDRVNGHYTALGYEQFAEILCRIWSEYINSFPGLFSEAAFIPYDESFVPEETIEIVQGDTWSDTLEIINQDGTAHEYSSSETVRFALSSSRSSSDVVVTKEMPYDDTNGVYVITLSAEETAALTADTSYWFDIGLQYGDTYTRIIKCQEIKVIPGISGAVNI